MELLVKHDASCQFSSNIIFLFYFIKDTKKIHIGSFLSSLSFFNEWVGNQF